MRIIPIQQYNRQTIDIEKIRADAGNPELQEADVFDFPKFLICCNGVNHNGDELTADAQRSAVSGWIGKPIVIDHDLKHTAKQIGRIYDAWTEDKDGETVTYGRAWALKATDPQEVDLQSKIRNRQHREMSLAADINRATCSACQSDLTSNGNQFTCPNGHAMGRDAHPILEDISPIHVSFVNFPAIDCAGTVTHARQDGAPDFMFTLPGDLTQEQRETIIKSFTSLDPSPPYVVTEPQLAEDGRLFRQWTTNEFTKWYRLNNKTASAEEIESLTKRLSAREMLTFARVEQSRFQEVIPSGAQQLTAPTDEAEQPTAPQYRNIQDIFTKKGI